ncbi:MAG: hypothetical protein DCF15_17255 [Phormidesmis priestleyi]|uniref:Uncharacterized protein n=1 Tax=Phormidesmis priestleyi TaxID=268141 RepID=A0A2W4Z255_9CYAN|nr:MAG: hypothetical protein DCF15_17255 [Phormidesmis priestleyi]
MVGIRAEHFFMKAIRKFILQERGRVWSRQQAEDRGMKIYSVKEYAAKIKYSINHTAKLAKCGRIEAFKVGGQWRIVDY